MSVSDEGERKARCFSDGVSKSPRYPGACIIHIFTPNILIIIILIFVRDGRFPKRKQVRALKEEKKEHGAHTRISLHFSRSFSAIGSSADTWTTFIQNENLYIYTYIAARLAKWNHYFVRNGGFSKMVAEDIFQTRLFCRSVEKLSTEIDS